MNGRVRRRVLLAAGLALLGAACLRRQPAQPVAAAPASSLPTQDWKATARGILLDARPALSVFEQYDTFRARRPQASPPPAAEWQAAVASVDGLRTRVAQLRQDIDGTAPQPTDWRERRVAADAARVLALMVESLTAYRVAVDRMAVEDTASGAARLLEQAKDRWRAAADAWGLEDDLRASR